MATKDTISIVKLNLTYVQVLNEENFKTMSHINSYMSIMQKCTSSWIESIDFIKLSIFKLISHLQS